MRVPLALLKPFNRSDIRLLYETRLLRVRAREGRDFVQERDVRLCEGSAIEVAHKGASDGERSDVGRCINHADTVQKECCDWKDYFAKNFSLYAQ
jgi:hypothetical protein